MISCIGFRLTYVHLILTHSKYQGHGYVRFDSEYLGNGEIYGKRYYRHQIEITYGVSIGTFGIDLDTF